MEEATVLSLLLTLNQQNAKKTRKNCCAPAQPSYTRTALPETERS